MNVKEYIIDRLDIAAFYRAVFSDYSPGNNVKCPFAKKRGHSEGQDSTASMSLSEDGKVYCHTCGYRATSPIGLIEDLLKISFKDACLYTFKTYVSPVVEAAKIKVLESILYRNPLALGSLKKKRGLTDATIKKYRLGWHGGRVSIPIFNGIGYCVDIRQYDLLGKFKKGTKVISWKKGYGGARLWPIESLKNKTLFLMEGETDTLLALQEGLPAITVTSGVQTFKENLARPFKGKKVVIVQDMDTAGKDGAAKRAEALSKAGASVKILSLPLKGTKEEKDFTDWVMTKGGTGKKLRALVGEQKDEIPAAAAPNVDSGGLDIFEKLTPAETVNMARAKAAMDYMRDHGAFFKNQEGDLFFVQQGGNTFRVHEHSEKFLSYLANKVSSLVNNATSSGRFVIQHVITSAHANCKSSVSSAWCTYHKGALWLTTQSDLLLKSRLGKYEIVKNAINKEGVLLESPAGNRPFSPDKATRFKGSLDMFWDLVICNIPINKADRFKVACWMLGVFFKEYIRPKPLLRFEARTASGKSTASKLISTLFYGDELLQHAATTSAATYVMARQYPLLIFDNIETRNMTNDFQDFLLIAATGGMKSKRQIATDTGVVQESAKCLVLTNGIEPISRHELITRTLDIQLDLSKFGLRHFHETKVLETLKRDRGKILSGLSRLLSAKVVPRIQRGDIPRIMRRFPPHAKERFNEYMALMAMILDAIWPYRKVPGYGVPHELVSEWLSSGTKASGEQCEGTNEVLYFLNTFAKRFNRLLDLETQCETSKEIVTIKGTTRELLSDWRVLAKQLGIRCPWHNERQLGTRIADAEKILKKAGWVRLKKIYCGKRMYEYKCKTKNIQ